MKQFLKNLIAPVVVGLLISALAQGAFYQWSTVPNNNSNSDPSINWAEGMSPSSVNDSARAMMAGLAQYRDDTSGKLTTGGTSTAYTVTTNQGLPSVPATGQVLVVTIHTTNGASPTLRADGGTIYPILTNPGNPVASGSLVQGTPYPLTFNGTGYVLQSFFQNANFVPIGAVLPYAGTAAPSSNFALTYGQCVSRSTYSILFTAVGTAYGACDGSTTFGLPDVRGRVIAGKDDMGGAAASRLTGLSGGVNGATLGAGGGLQTHTLIVAEMPSHGHALTDPGHVHSYEKSIGGYNAGSGGSNVLQGPLDTFSTSKATTGITMSNTGGDQPHNNVQPTIILNYIIRII